MSWKNWETAVNKGPGTLLIKIGVLIIVVSIVLTVIGTVFSWFGEASDVTQEEFGPRALLVKYEWFKDAAAGLDAKVSNIRARRAELTNLEQAYEGVQRSTWPRDDRERFSQIFSELVGIKMSYNNLAAEYNAAMAKFNWRFANKGNLPEGASQPLPREFKPYINN